MLVATRKSHWVYNLLLFVMAFSFLIVWLPMLRSAFDGESYQWGNSYFGIALSGKGMTLSWLFLFAQFVFYTAVFMAVYWMKNRPITYLLIGLWYLLFFGNMLYEVIGDPDATFRGDTLGVVVPLIYIVIPLALLGLGLVIWMYKLDKNSPESSIPWNQKNTQMAWLILGPLPIQWVLLHFGEHLSSMDQVGVIITIVQCLLIPLIVRPYLLD